MKISKFQIAVLFGILIIGLISFIDIGGVNLIGYENYTSGNFDNSVWIHHLQISLILMLIPSLLYFFFYRKDKSETIAIFLVPFINFWFGACDVFYFWFQGKAIPSILSHLNNHPIIGRISNILGYSNVNPISLLISVLVGIIFTYYLTKFLKNKL